MTYLVKNNRSFFIIPFLLINLIYSQNNSNQIFGFITDSKSGEALIGANVFIQESGKGMATDINGYYVISGIEMGEVTLVASYVGYKRFEKKINFDNNDANLKKSINLNISMEVQALEILQIDVTAEEIERLNKIEPSRINLSPRMLKAQPALAEPDIFRTIQSLPGVLTNSELSTGLIIRGGNTDQNLILLDGITVYNPSHMGGIFSNFIVDAVKDAELIKGGYNAEYGGRLSAVLDITSREGNRNEFEGKASVSLLSAQTTMEGPFLNGAWLFSGRRTYFDLLLPKVLPKETADNIPPYYFYDLQGHVFTDLNEKDRISFSFYNGIDDFSFNDLDLTAYWGNQTGSFSYRRVFAEKLIGNFLLAKSRFFTRFSLGGDFGLNSTNYIDDITASGDLSYFSSENFNIFFGGQLKNYAISYTSSFGDSSTFDLPNKSTESSLYTKVKWKPNNKIIIEPGIRLNTFTSHDQTLYPDFRLGAKYIINPSQFINMAVGNYHQFIETFQDDFNPPFLDNWVAIDNSVGPAMSTQFVLGYEQYIGSSYKFQVEGYYKDISNLLTFEDQTASTDGNTPTNKLSDILTQADGYAYGLELFGQKTAGKLSGWVAYTWSVSRKKMNGMEYFTNWDRSHVLNILGSYQANQKYELNWKWTLQSGQAHTPINGYFIENLPGDPEFRYRTIPGTRNGGRYPPYHRLDIGMVRHSKIKNTKFDLFFQIINSYNRENIFRYGYSLGSTYNGIDDDGDWEEKKHDKNGNKRPDVGETNVDEPDEGRIQRQEINLFPIIPTIGITFEF